MPSRPTLILLVANAESESAEADADLFSAATTSESLEYDRR